MDAGARLLVSDGCSEMVSVKGSEDEPRDDHRQSTSGGGLAATEAIPFTNPITGNQIKVYVNPKPGTLRGDAETPRPSGEACAHVIAVAGGNIAAARRRRITRTRSTRSATADIRLRQAARRDSRMSPGRTSSAMMPALPTSGTRRSGLWRQPATARCPPALGLPASSTRWDPDRDHGGAS